jgi:site-specific DNA recombinase
MRAFLYCRKSSESEDRQVMSLDAQETELRRLAERDGIEVVKVVRESMSAKAPGRPLFMEMLREIGDGSVDSILCWKLDRLARNPVDGGSISWLLQQNQLRAIITHERTYLPSDNVLLMSVEFGMSNQYIRDLSANVKRGNREKLRRGEWPNRAPYGYRNDRNTKTLVVHPAEAVNVRKIYELYNAGTYSIKDIAKSLGMYKSQVAKILERSMYCGAMVADGIEYEGKYEPLISRQTFDLAQEVKNGVRVSPLRPKSLFFPFRGFLQCGECGCRLTATKKKGRYDYYYCTNGKGGCSQHMNYLTESDTTKLVSTVLGDIPFDTETIEIMYEAARERLETDHNEVELLKNNLTTEIEQITRQERKLLQTFTAELIDEVMYKDEALRLKKEKAGLSTSLAKLNQTRTERLATLELTKKVFLDCNTMVSEFSTATPDRKRKITETLLWNFAVKDEKVLKINYKPAYEVMANAPKSGDLETMLPVRDSNPNSRYQKPKSYH